MCTGGAVPLQRMQTVLVPRYARLRAPAGD